MLTKRDARGTTASYSYDVLNRVTQRSYNGGTAVPTSPVTYAYDASAVTYSKGRLTSVSNSVSAYNYTGYDALGRITASQQLTDGQSHSMSYQYDLAGNMTSQTYPTGRVVTQSFDNTGRLANISGQSSGGTPKTYANSFGYSSHGAVERMRLGNGRWEHTNFNNRLQTTEIGLGSSATDSSVLKLNYEYGTSTNNGNVLKQVITVPTIGTATGFTATQHYQYDQLNRLTGAQEVNGVSSAWQSSGALWQQKFSYDRYGNRAVDTANTTSTMIGPNPQVSTSNNRIVPRTSPVEYYQYDAAGNMTKGQSGDNFAYDAENKLVQYQGGSAQSGGANYSYDGDGRRIKKATPSETLIFVYNIAGQLVAEYTTSTPEQNGTSYLTGDTLGTPRVITKADGSVRARHDYLPFGEETFASTGNRTTNQGYDQSSNPADKTRQKFTSKERDNETGLDYSINRYYSPMQGRFTSVDPLGASAIVADPQSFNRYTYVLNNPLKYVDPDGLDGHNPWASLTDKEKNLLASKLTTVTGAGQMKAATEVFNKLVTVTNKDGTLNEDLTNSNIASVQNFVGSLASDSKVWRQIQSIDKVSSTGNGRQSNINFTVKDRGGFLDALTNTKDAFGKNRFVNLGDESGHVDSMREIGYGVTDPSMHIGRDGTGDTKFGAHWDPSTALTHVSVKEVVLDTAILGLGAGRRVAAGLYHKTGPATTQAVREYLKVQGLVPRN